MRYLWMLAFVVACQGPTGPQGNPGPSGTSGANGSSCTATTEPYGTLVTCAEGSSTILNGSDGAAGANGYTTLVTSSAAPAALCPTLGYVLSIGLDANRNGLLDPSEIAEVVPVCNGAAGATGPQGSAGRNATPVTPVQFCPNYTLKYPTTFPEFGLEIGSSLFAVYWDGKNAWLAEIAPGYYASTSTSAPCDFTVNNDGTITEH